MSVEIQVYSVAFAFYREDVLLIRKAKPDWQKGLLNGIGGKMEPGDINVLDTTRREFVEETGLFGARIDPIIYHAMAWKEYLTHKQPVVYFSAFEIEQHDMFTACQNTQRAVEPCHIVPLKRIQAYNHEMMPNLPFLIQMAQCLVRCTPEERRLRTPIILNEADWRAYFNKEA